MKKRLINRGKAIINVLVMFWTVLKSLLSTMFNAIVDALSFDFKVKKVETLVKNTDLWMYPPVIESEIHPFISDERCEKCVNKGVHRRQYVPSLKLLLTQCVFCGATWWQRPADYNATVQISNMGKVVEYPHEFSRKVADNMKATLLDKSKLSQEYLPDLHLFKHDKVDAIRYIVGNFFTGEGRTGIGKIEKKKDDENGA